MEKLGQHFLKNEEILDKMVEYAEISSDDVVLEIGVGTGNLTRKIAEKKCTLYAYEKDHELFEDAELEFQGLDNIELMRKDAVKTDWPWFNKMVASIPYRVSKKILIKLLLADFEVAVLVVQKEFAKKLVAKPGEDNYRMISVFAQTAADIMLLDDVPPSFFSPPPKVDSKIIKVMKKDDVGVDYADFLTTVFNQKNKKLKHSSKNAVSFRDEFVKTLTPQQFLIAYSESVKN